MLEVFRSLDISPELVLSHMKLSALKDNKEALQHNLPGLGLVHLERYSALDEAFQEMRKGNV